MLVASRNIHQRAVDEAGSEIPETAFETESVPQLETELDPWTVGMNGNGDDEMVGNIVIAETSTEPRKAPEKDKSYRTTPCSRPEVSSVCPDLCVHDLSDGSLI